MYKFSLIASILLLLSVFSCNKEEPDTKLDPSNSIDCDALFTALTDEDAQVLPNILNPILANYIDQDIDNDACPHTRKLDGFIEELNSSCSLTASLFCCICIETFPEQSEVIVQYSFNGENLERILDLVSPLEIGQPLTFGGVHQ